jgi:hypothetical protein
MKVKTPKSTPETSSFRPPSRSSLMESRSLVWREIIRPEVYDSWNSRLRRWVCRKMRLRRSSRTAWVSLAAMMTYQAMSTAARAPASR